MRLEIPGEGRQSQPDVDGRRDPDQASVSGRRGVGSPGVIAALAGLAAFLVYFRTLSISIAWGDSPELTTAAYLAGVPHPTGYPLYMMIAHAFLRYCPLGSVAYRMNLLSALSASLAVALIYPLTVRIARGRWVSLIVTLMFAFSLTFWSQAVIAEVYAFQMLCTTALLLCILTWDAGGERRWLYASALVYGICCCHHGMSVLLFPGLLYFALTSRHRLQFFRSLPWALLLFLLPLGSYIYLPLAALRDSPTNWGDPSTWPRFIQHVTGAQYHGAMFQMSWAQRAAEFRSYTGIGLHGAGFLRDQFGPSYLLLAAVGVWFLARRRSRLFGLTLLIYVVDLIFALNYKVFDVDVYYLPSHLMVAIWIACGMREVGAGFARLWRRLAMAPSRRVLAGRALAPVLLVGPLSLLLANWRANDLHGDWSAITYARGALAILKPNAILIGSGDYAFLPLLYPRFVENRRPDITIVALLDTLYPGHERLVTRLRSERVRVRLPQSPHPGPTSVTPDDYERLKSLVADNIDSRPVYLMSPPSDLRSRDLASVMKSYYPAYTSNSTCVELTRRAPALADRHPAPQRTIRAAFASPAQKGSPDCLELLGCDFKPVLTGGGPLLQMTYYWHVNDLAQVRPAKVWVVFTDPTGNYRRTEDGMPEFHNIHPLAYGLGQSQASLPRTLKESYSVYVPVEDRGRQLRARIAVGVNGQFMQTGTYGSPWVDLGPLPLVPRDNGSCLLASAAPRWERE